MEKKALEKQNKICSALTEDEKFKLELESSCKTKEGEWEEICKTRSEELLALSETIKILNDDDALELFKKARQQSGRLSLELEAPACMNVCDS